MAKAHKNSNVSFHSVMEEHFVDSDGKTVIEAVELGMSMIEFVAAVYEGLGMFYKKKDARSVGILASLYLTMVTEKTAQAIFDDSSEMDTFIAMFKAADEETGLQVQKTIYGPYHDIMKNDFFKLDAANVMLRVLLAESVMRIIGVAQFSQNPDSIYIAQANAGCAYHFIPMIAYLASGDLDKYTSMFTNTEIYFHGELQIG